MNLFLYALGLSICSSTCLSVTKMRTQKLDAHVNKCIGDDTKSAARQSLNCIKNKKNMAKNDFQYAGRNSYTCNVARSRH